MTDNIDNTDDLYLRYGFLPDGCSANHNTGGGESGVSVYEVTVEGGQYKPAGSPGLSAVVMIKQGRTPLLVRGDKIGTGSEGEPVLEPESVEIVTPLDTNHRPTEMDDEFKRDRIEVKLAEKEMEAVNGDTLYVKGDTGYCIEQDDGNYVACSGVYESQEEYDIGTVEGVASSEFEAKQIIYDEMYN